MKRLPAIPVYLALSAGSSLFFGIISTASAVYQVTVVGLSPLQLVLVGTALEASVFLFEVPTGIVADIYSRRLSIVIGYLLIGMGFLLEGLVPTFGAILIGQVLWGIGFTFTSGATEAWIADEVGEKKAGQAFVRGSQAGLAGGVLGILISMLIGAVRVSTPIIAGGALLAALGVFLGLLMPETGFHPTPRENRTSWQQMVYTFRAGLKLVSGRPSLVNLVLISLFFGLYSEGFDRLWTAHLLENFSFPLFAGQALQPLIWFGVLRLVGTLLTLGVTELARRRFNPDHPRISILTLLVSSSLLVLGLLVFALTGNLALALAAYWSISVTRSLNDPYLTAWINRHLESGVRATVISMTGQIDALGQITAGPVMGGIGSAFGIRPALVTSALILSPVLGFLGRAIGLDRRERKDEPLPAPTSDG